MMFYDYFLLFMMYSFLGWILEGIYFIIINRKIVDRGFLVGPYLPIYGFGALLIVIFLQKYSEDFITLFCMCTIICSVLEYFTSYIMEKLFRARWWDYRDKSFNINGRVCLENSVLFGLGGCITVYIIHPFFKFLLSIIPITIRAILLIVLLILLLVDILISFKIIFSFRNFISDVKKDSTSEINKLVKRVISSNSILGKRLIQAFPNFSLSFNRIKRNRILFFRKEKK